MTATQAPTAPVLTDAQLLNRVDELIGPASTRTLWPLFFDREGFQLPVLIPICELPQRPAAEDTERLVAFFAKLTADDDLGAIVFALERPGSAIPAESDVAFLRQLAEASRRRAMPLRGLVLVHDEGSHLVDCSES